SGHVRQLSPKHVDAVKRMIGVPDEAFAHLMPRTIGSPAVVRSHLAPRLTPIEHASLWTTARNAILGHSATVGAAQLASVNQWLVAINPSIIIALFQDITVQTDAQLIIAPDVHILFANNILIEQGGQIVCQGTITKFDCSSLKGFAPTSGPGT